MAPDSSRTQALFDKLQRLSRPSSSLKSETVHQLRTTIRRVETLFATIRRAPGRKEQKFLKRLCRLRRRAGRVRDLDVQIAALGGLGLESITRDRARVMSFLQKARAMQEKRLLRALQDEADAGLRKRLNRAFGRLQQEFPKPAERKAAEDRFLAAALRKFTTVVKRHPTLTEGNLHDFRMDCKRARYLAEMAGEGPKAVAAIAQLKRIQDAIGNWHDWLTLTTTAESVLSHSEQVPLLPALRASTRSRYLEALRITADAMRALLEMRESTSTARENLGRGGPSTQSRVGRPGSSLGPDAEGLTARAATA